MDAALRGFGPQLRHWRRQRGLTQLALALDADVSTRHLSWLEADKSVPSRAMVLRLADRLDVPLRERNAWLQAAGYAALYPERSLSQRALQSVQALLDAHAPNPALAVDRHWQLVAANRMLPLLLADVDPALLAPPVNVLRLALHPRGLARRIMNLPAWHTHILLRLRRQARMAHDAVLLALHDELQGLACSQLDAADLPPGESPDDDPVDDALALPLVLASARGELRFMSTVTVFGAPHDIALSELALETLLPADVATAEALRQLDPGVS